MKKLIEELTRPDWVVTIPKVYKWKDYQKELDAVRDGKSVINYKVRAFPQDMKIGDRCFIVYDGKVRGWMRIVGMKKFDREWFCQTTGHAWPAGKYIQRSGRFFKVDGPEMRGFRGVRKLNVQA